MKRNNEENSVRRRIHNKTSNIHDHESIKKMVVLLMAFMSIILSGMKQ